MLCKYLVLNVYLYKCAYNIIMNKSKALSLIVAFSVHYSPTNECLPKNSSHEESFLEVQDDVEN